MGDYYYNKQGELMGSGEDVVAGLEHENDKLKQEIKRLHSFINKLSTVVGISQNNETKK